MPLSNNLNLYSDVRTTLDQALRADGGTLAFADAREATHWCHRANKLRALLGREGPTPYDGMRFRRREATVEIELAQPQGHFTPRQEAPSDEGDFDFEAALAQAQRALEEDKK